MSTEARVRIESHRLMRETEKPDHEVRVESMHQEIHAKARQEKSLFRRRAYIHTGIFVTSFIFTTGFLVLSVLLWVRPDTFVLIVAIGILSSLVFVATFSTLRMLILSGFMDEYPNKEEDPGFSHHLAKSIAYGFIALVFAIILAGLCIKIASASGSF